MQCPLAMPFPVSPISLLNEATGGAASQGRAGNVSGSFQDIAVDHARCASSHQASGNWIAVDSTDT